MTEEMNQVVYLLREGACCCACNEAYPTIDRPYPCEQRIRTNNNMDKAADLIESLAAELERVKREQDAME